MTTICKADYYYGALLSALVNGGLAPALFEKENDNRQNQVPRILLGPFHLATMRSKKLSRFIRKTTKKKSLSSLLFAVRSN